MPGESMKKTIIVALAVCIACSLLVSTAEVTLRDFRYKNKKLDRIRNILKAAELPDGRDEAVRVYEERGEARTCGFAQREAGFSK